MRIWILLFAGGLITFGIRFSLIFLFGKFQIPETLRRSLHYVPPAVLSAIILPELLYRDSRLLVSLDNTRLIAGIVAILVGWFTKNSLITILSGLGALLLLQAF